MSREETQQEVMKGADVPHCEADASDARGKITCYPNASTQPPSNAIYAITPVIFRPLAENGKWPTHLTRIYHILQHLLWLP